jgi:ammonium transporter Rh
MTTHEGSRRIFAIVMIVVEIIVIIMFGLFVRPLVHNDPTNNTSYYPEYQDVNVMMLIGFGFLMTFIKHHSWSALVYTFFINAIHVQLYMLLAPFWQNVFIGNWTQPITYVEKTFTSGSYSVAAILISFGAVIGRVGPL